MARYSGYPGTVTVQVNPSSGESDGADESQATNSDSAGGVTQQASASQAHKVSKSMNDFVKRYKVQAATTSYETNIRFMFPFWPPTGKHHCGQCQLQQGGAGEPVAGALV